MREHGQMSINDFKKLADQHTKATLEQAKISLRNYNTDENKTDRKCLNCSEKFVGSKTRILCASCDQGIT